MIRNYLKIAWRNLWKSKTFTFLNITGLSIAFAVVMLLGMAAFYDLSYDKFHKNKDEIYKLYATSQTVKGAEASTSNPVPLAPSLKEEVPGISHITRYLHEGALASYQDKELYMDLSFVDKDFFSIFSFPSTSGSNNPLQEKNAVAISQRAAKNIFGDKEAVGQIINLQLGGEMQPYTVAAVIKDMEPQSSIDFDIAINFENHPDYAEMLDEWGSSNHDVFLMLQEGTTITQFEKASRSFVNSHYEGDIKNLKRDGAQPDSNGQIKQFHLFPFKDSHFITFENGLATTNKTFPYLILGISLLILFIASVNFVNMSIAKSAQRLREIGMRKTLGAAKSQLFFQFWSESIVIFITSLVIGVLITKLCLDPFKTLFKTEADFGNITTPAIFIGFLISFIVITLIAGGYPALLLSKLGTLQALKGKLNVSGGNRLRDSLMVVQFGIAILLISGTFILHGQLKYMRNKDLGYNKEQVIAFPINGKKESRLALQLLRNELENNPNILNVTASDNILGRGKDGSTYSSVLGFDHKGRGIKTNMLVVDYDYLNTLDIKLVSGRSFNRQFARDSLALVINEAMVKELGEGDPLATTLIVGDSTAYSIIGVVKDYNFQNLDKKIAPLTLFMNTDWDLYFAYVKVAPQNIAQSFELVKTAWNKVEPNAEFQGSFLDKNVDRTFRREKTMTTIITSGSVIAIVLSCIGLFAISMLVVAQRTKEIGIRKTVGASVTAITLLLTKDFLKLVGIAFLIATPIAWWFMNKWLQNYANRIELNVWYFIAAGIFAIGIALCTLSFRTIQAALQNPVKSLKTE